MEHSPEENPELISLFGSLPSVSAPATLGPAILSAILFRQKQLLRRAAFFDAGLSAVFLGLALYVFPLIGQQFIHSGLTDTLSLLLSDIGTVTANWRDYSYLILETLPLLPLVAGLAAITGLLYALKSTAENFTKAYYLFASKSRIYGH